MLTINTPPTTTHLCPCTNGIPRASSWWGTSLGRPGSRTSESQRCNLWTRRCACRQPQHRRSPCCLLSRGENEFGLGWVHIGATEKGEGNEIIEKKNAGTYTSRGNTLWENACHIPFQHRHHSDHRNNHYRSSTWCCGISPRLALRRNAPPDTASTECGGLTWCEWRLYHQNRSGDYLQSKATIIRIEKKVIMFFRGVFQKMNVQHSTTIILYLVLFTYRLAGHLSHDCSDLPFTTSR